jgi:hypothetical protein
VTDDLTIKRLAGQLLRGVKAVYEENNPGRPLCLGAPVRPHVAAEHIGNSPVGHRYAATLAYLVEERALEPKRQGEPRRGRRRPALRVGK